jgi:hypothetical protein
MIEKCCETCASNKRWISEEFCAECHWSETFIKWEPSELAIKLEETEVKLQQIEEWAESVLIIKNQDGFVKYRPIKNTSKDNVYKAMFKIQTILRGNP